MGKSRSHPSRPTPAPAPPRSSALAGPAFSVGVFLTIYALLFFLMPLSGAGGATRAGLLSRCLLLPDEQIFQYWFGNPATFALIDRLQVLVIAAVMFVPIALAGWLLLGLLRAERGLTRLERVFFSGCLGFAATGLYMLAIGLFGQLQNRGAVLAPAAIVCVAAAARWWLLKDPQPEPLIDYEPPAEEHAHATPADRRWLWAGLPFVIAIALAGALPPIDFDVREYHLQAPKEFYEQGAITFLPHNVYANMPSGSEMISLLAMQALGDWRLGALVGKTLIALCAPWTALGLLAAGRRWGGNRSGVVAALLFVSLPWIAQVSSAGMVEGVSAMFLWGAVYATLLWRHAPPASRLPRVLLAGALAGAAVACKYPNLVFVAIPLAAYVTYCSRRRPAAHSIAREHAARAQPAEPAWRKLAPVVAFLLAAGVVCGPWFAKNWVFTSNPVYPLAQTIFGGETRTEELVARWQKAHAPPGYSPEKLLESIVDVAVQNSLASILLAPLVALALLGSRHRKLAFTLALFAAYYLITWWLFTHRLPRFWAPALPVLAMLGSLAFTDPRWSSCRPLLNGFLALGLATNFLHIVAGGAGDNAYFVRTSQLWKDPSRVDPWKVFLNENVAAGDAVLAVGDAEVFDLDRPVYYNTVFDPNLFDAWFQGRTPDEIRQTLADHHVSHVYLNWGEIRRYRGPGNYGYSNYIQPQVLEGLVKAGVLDKPLTRLDGNPNEVYPVHRPRRDAK